MWTVAAVAMTTASAGEIVKRDFAVIQDALMNLNSLLQQLDTSILALNEDNIKTDGPALLRLAEIIQPSLIGSAKQIEDSSPLTLQETLSLNTARTALNQNINLTVSDLIKQKPLFDSANLSQQVADEVQVVREMSSQFLGLIETKLDPGAPSQSSQFNSALAVFDSVIATFRGMPTQATGAFSGPGSCVCVAICPAGSFFTPPG